MLFYSMLFLCCIQIVRFMYGDLVLEFVAETSPAIDQQKTLLHTLNGYMRVLNHGIATIQKSRT